ncbi:hypothetical protein SAMN05720615_11828 [Stenotrophomonas indicatrix]|nr:hypothetical protein SAMN05720615_109220 [Stenotrophomonas indicatrix]SEU12623.1 hypothetical protein SAMN05720615_11828 [Stenotrophomonas indicatrix]
MLNRKARLSLMACVLATSACSSAGQAVRPECPTLPPAPASLMAPPTTEQTVRGELFVPLPPVTLKSVDSKPW